MRITQEGDYALRIVLYLCKRGLGTRVEAKVIAESENIPFRFLLKLFRKLTKAGIAVSYRGVGGGYALGKTPDQITLRDVIEAIEGPVSINRCLYDASYCNLQRANECQVHKVLYQVQEELVKSLEKIRFKDILDGNI